jgi:hypothetical protein
MTQRHGDCAHACHRKLLISRYSRVMTTHTCACATVRRDDYVRVRTEADRDLCATLFCNRLLGRLDVI